MNLESNRKIEVARTEDEMYEKLEQLKAHGYAESDIHVISKEHSHMSTLNRHSEVATHEAGTFMDKFKSWFTGEDAVTEGLRKLDLNEAETERYSKDVASGGFVLYTEGLKEGVVNSPESEFEQGYDTLGATGNSYESYSGEERHVQPTEPGFEDTTRNDTHVSTNTEFVESRFNETDSNVTGNEHFTGQNESTTFGAEEPRSETTLDNHNDEPQSKYSQEQGFAPSTNDFVNETDGRFDEPQDRFARGETFATDPYLAREEDHIGHSTQEDKMVQEHRPTTDERITNEQQTDGFQSPGADPNLGPAAFGVNTEENEFPSGDMKNDFDKDPRVQGDNEERVFGTEYTSGKHNEPTNKFEENKLNEVSNTNTDEYEETGYEQDGHGNAFAFDTNSTDNEILSGGVDDDEEDVTTDKYKERLESDKIRSEVHPNNKLF
ncbi:general stress protein [Paenisporosarcina sp.]|uniref:general stress protein n=1 Tax=Paenisporosarcina sp. TaxID=1932001 RepID=UPI003C73D0B3